MLQTDSKLDFDRPIEGQFNAGEQGDTLILGGLEESGNDVTNELTFLFLKAHRELKLTYPKIHIRFSSRTPAVLFQEAAKDFLADRNVLSFLNDDIVIPSQIMAGKTPESAARYVAGGCWENILEGYEHSQGANSYFSLGKCVDLSIHEENEDEKSLELPFRKLDGATSFEGVYSIVMDNIKLALHQLFSIQQKYGALWTQVYPCPFFTACQNGCAESGRDYSAGGAQLLGFLAAQWCAVDADQRTSVWVQKRPPAAHQGKAEACAAHYGCNACTFCLAVRQRAGCAEYERRRIVYYVNGSAGKVLRKPRKH